MIRGINLKMYYNLLKNLDDGNTEGMTKSEYKKAIIKMFAEDLDKNLLNNHIYEEDITLDNRNYFGRFKIENDTMKTLYIEFLHDSVLLNGLYIKY